MNIKDLKIFFLGTSYFSAKIIEDLVEKGIPIAMVVTQPDRPVGRKKEITPPEAKKIAKEKNIPVKQFEKIDTEAMNFFLTENPDLIIVASYGLILPKELLDLPKFDCINVHTSLLPALRGPSPIQTALLEGFEKTGVSIMIMDEEVDHGPVLSQKEVSISPEDDYNKLEEKLIKVSNEILAPAVQDFLDKKIEPQEQKHHEATFTKIISKKDGQIIWSSSAKEIENLFKAYCVWPKVFCFWEKENQPGNPQKIIFWEISSQDESVDSKDKKYGEVFRNSEGKICIKTGKGIILPKKLQLPGKNAIEIEEFINGQPSFIGTILS